MPAPGHTVRVLLDGIHPTIPELVIERPINTSSCRYDHRLCALFKNMPISKVVMLFFLVRRCEHERVELDCRVRC